MFNARGAAQAAALLRALCLLAAECAAPCGALLPGLPALARPRARVEIFYDSLNPSAADLLLGSFQNLFADSEFGERVEFELVPFGNARMVPEENVSEGYHFFHEGARYPLIKCEREEEECLGNEIQACALDLLGHGGAVPLVLCMTQRTSGFAKGRRQGVELASHSCMQELGLDPGNFRRCVGSANTHLHMVALGRRSASVAALNKTRAPWVVADGRPLALNDRQDLVGPLCRLMVAPKPAACSGVELFSGLFNGAMPAHMPSFVAGVGVRSLAQGRQEGKLRVVPRQL